jgi:hypothetical protein
VGVGEPQQHDAPVFRSRDEHRVEAEFVARRGESTAPDVEAQRAPDRIAHAPLEMPMRVEVLLGHDRVGPVRRDTHAPPKMALFAVRI